jgi:anti-sigma-K factor RskA
MTREHDALRDLIAPVAVGAAEPNEVVRVDAHAADCPVCREELESLRASADVLAVAVPMHEPRPELKASIMGVVRAEAAAGAPIDAPVAPPATVPARRRWWLPSVGLRPALATVAAIAALLLGWNIALQLSDDPAPDPGTTLSVAGTADAPGVTGRIVYLPEEDTALVRLERLPALEPGEAYQLWVLRDGSAPRSAGLFRQIGPAEAERVATGLAGADGLAVTAQPRTSRVTPEGPILVQAELRSA